jgi:hypothetical protein
MRIYNRFNVLDVDQQSTGFLKHVENKVKPLAAKTKSQKRKVLLLGSSRGWEIGPMLKEHSNTEYENPIRLLLMSLRTWGSLVMTLPSKIILL